MSFKLIYIIVAVYALWHYVQRARQASACSAIDQDFLSYRTLLRAVGGELTCSLPRYDAHPSEVVWHVRYPGCHYHHDSIDMLRVLRTLETGSGSTGHSAWMSL